METGSAKLNVVSATYTIIFVTSMIHQWKHSKKINRAMHLASTLLYILVTMVR